jgi:hypothetical protein
MPIHERAASPQDEQATNVRHLQGVGWQVLEESSAQWYTCRKEQDACFIASGLRTLDAVARGVLFHKEVAEELEAVAAVVSRVLGPQAAERMMQAAELVRSTSAK